MKSNKVTYSLCSTEDQLRQILHLQKINSPENIDSETFKSQGFVTARHELPLLTEMNTDQKHVIAESDGNVVAYALSMTQRFSDRLPVLKPMFDILNELSFGNQPVNELDYFIMGQVCVAKDFRSKGVFVQLYEKMREAYCENYHCLITEIDDLNPRSMAAHKKVGFEMLHQYQSNDGKLWNLVIWDWRD